MAFSGTRGRVDCVIADDHDFVRAAVRTRLARLPWLSVVGEAADGHEALGLIAELRPAVALIDLRMPGLNGVDVVERVRAAAIPTRVVLNSASIEPELVRRAFSRGAAAYIEKGATIDVIEAAVRAAAAGGYYVDPSVSTDSPRDLGAPDVVAMLSSAQSLGAARPLSSLIARAARTTHAATA